MLFAIIMAGGSGTRFWPKSRRNRPKQLLNLHGDATMLQQTVARIAPLVPPERILIITGADQAEATREQLPQLPSANVIAEPCPRDTAPCVALAAARIARALGQATRAIQLETRATELQERFDAAFWDRTYSHRHASRNGAPNALLVDVADGLAAGVALDAGCGEGVDALWLAERGWTVTAADISNVALERARAADGKGAVTWLRADLLTWRPPAATYDLVSAHFLHVPPAARPAFFDGLAHAVRLGGTLLVVAHHPSDRETKIGRPPIPDLYFRAEEVVATLAPESWAFVFAGTQPRSVRDREGRDIVIHDMVLRARRIA